jgi:hypothetical protein
MSLNWNWLILFYCAAPLAAGYAIVSRRKSIGKMGRLPYFLRVFISSVVIYTAYKVLLKIVSIVMPIQVSMEALIFFLVAIDSFVYVASMSLIVFWTIERLNDVGAGKFQAVAVAIPLVGMLFVIYLCFKRGRPAELAEAPTSTPIEFDERLAERKRALVRRESETKEN